MNDSAPVGRIQCGCNLAAVSKNFVCGKRTFLQSIGKRFAFQKFHDYVMKCELSARRQYGSIGICLNVSHIVERANIGVTQLGDGFRFAFKSLTKQIVCGKFRRQNLDRNFSVQTRIFRAPYFPHSTRAEMRDYFVGAKSYTNLNGHEFLLILSCEFPSVRRQNHATVPLWCVAFQLAQGPQASF